jgi:hypothetical protein
LIGLARRLARDSETIADFRRDKRSGDLRDIQRFIEVCRRLNLFAHVVEAIDGSKFKAVNAAARTSPAARCRSGWSKVEASIERYLWAVETADRQEGELAAAKSASLKDKTLRFR